MFLGLGFSFAKSLFIDQNFNHEGRRSIDLLFMQNNEISLETEDQISAYTDDFDKLIKDQTDYFMRLHT